MRVFFVLAIAGALLLYSSGLWAPFHLDDNNVLTIARSLSWSTRPLGYASFWLNEQIALLVSPMFPWNAAFYQRLGNVFIHALAATALFWLVRELTGRTLAASIAGTLFLVHPIQTQAVTYVTQRFESQAAMLMLVSAATYVRFRRTRLKRWLTASVVCGAAAGFTKETAFVLPVWLVFIELTFFRGEGKWGQTGEFPFSNPRYLWKKGIHPSGPISLLRPRIVYVLPLGLVLLFPVWRTLPALTGAALTWIPWDQYWISQGPVIVKYFTLATWPRQQFLFYSFQPIDTFSWQIVLQWAIVLSVAGAALYVLKRSPLIGFGILSFFILLLPVIVLPLPDLINEHRLYPAFAGIAIAAGGFVQIVDRKPALVITGILAALFSVKTFMRNSEWNDPIAFMESHRSAFPHDPAILSRLASYYYTNGYVNKALELNLAARRYEDQYNAYYSQQGHLLTSVNLASIYLAKDNPDAAKVEALRAIAANPTEPLAWRALGYTQLQMGDYKEAQTAFERLVALQPSSDSWQSLEIAATRSGDRTTAFAAAERVKIENQKAASAEAALFRMPSKYQTHVIFGITVAILAWLAWALRTLWAALQKYRSERQSLL